MIEDIEAFRHALLAFRGNQVLTLAHRFVQRKGWIKLRQASNIAGSASRYETK